MLFRIDLDHFLIHAIDHFNLDELISFQYAIIGVIPNQGRRRNVAKLNSLYPSSEIQQTWFDYKDKDILKKQYYEELDGSDKIIYRTFIVPFMNHENIVIVCKREENPIIDVLVEYIKEKFGIETIDLNELFSKGRIGPIYIDRAKINKKSVDIRRASGKEMIQQYEQTSGGRLKLLQNMNTKDKIRRLKKIGIEVKKSDLKNLDELLMDAWVNGED